MLLPTLLALATNFSPAPQDTPHALQETAPLSAESVLSADDLTADLALLRRALTEVHPGLLRYGTKAELEARFDALAEHWKTPRSLRVAYLALSELLASFRCGHTYANFFNQSDAVRAALFDSAPCLPFAFRWIDGEMIVTRSASKEARLSPGVRILSIDGRPCAELRTRLLRLARADGGNDAKRLALLSVSGEEPYETFDVFFPLLFPPAIPSSFRLECEDLAGARFQVVAPSMLATQRNALLAERASSTPKSLDAFTLAGWATSEPAPHVALLRMDTWVAYKTDADWRAELDAFVDRIVAAETQHLIVDLRRNEGGNDCGSALLARLIEKPLTLPSTARHVRCARTPEELNAFLDTWDDTFRNWGEFARPVERAPALLGEAGAFFRLRRDASDDPGAQLAPSERPRLRAKLWVLVGPTNSSATFQFASAVQGAKLGVLVGAPTGGNQRGINGGAFFFLRLPRTGLEVDLPLIAYTPCDAQGREIDGVPDAGLTPDIVVRTTRAEIAADADPELRAVLAAIASGR